MDHQPLYLKNVHKKLRHHKIIIYNYDDHERLHLKIDDTRDDLIFFNIHASHAYGVCF